MNFIRRKKWYFITGGILLVVAAYFLFFRKDAAPLQTVTVMRGDIAEEVSVTGSVQPIHSAELAFEQSGRISGVFAKVGDSVYAGGALVSLDNAGLEAQLAKAQADLASRQSDLDKYNIDLTNYYGDIPNLLNDAYAKADDATRNQLAALFANESMNATLTFSVPDVAISNDVRSLRTSAITALTQWASELQAINGASTHEQLLSELTKSEAYLVTVRSLLSRSMDAVVNANNSVTLSSATVTTYKTSITTGKTEVNTVLSGLTAQAQAISAAQATIASVEASVKSYAANADNIKAQLAKLTLFSPITGVVTIQNAKVGEIAGANAVMVSVISANKFEVNANVAEADIAKVKEGDSAAITLDAYGNNVVFAAKVSSIDPGETIVEGVATYKTKLQFTKADSRIKSGMTANITIFTNKKTDVLVIPQRLVTTQNGTSSVTVDLGNGESAERIVKIGLKGADGNVEVLTGLSEGDKVIMSTQ